MKDCRQFYIDRLRADRFQEAIKTDANNPTYHYHLGLAYQKTNSFDLAKKQFQYALQLNPNPDQAGEMKKFLAEPSAQKN